MIYTKLSPRRDGRNTRLCIRSRAASVIASAARKIANLASPRIYESGFGHILAASQTKSDEGAGNWRSQRSRPHSALFASDIIRRESDAVSKRKFIQMDSRNVPENAFVCLAGRLR